MSKRLFSALFFTFCFSQSLHAELINFAGYVSITNGSLYISDGRTGYQLKPGTAKATQDLGKFVNGDYLSGVAERISPNLLLVRGIDFVGLKRILGSWISGNTRYDFTSFINVRASADAFPAIATAPHSPGTVTDWKYSLAPGKSNVWKMLISNASKVNVAELAVNGNTALITVFNPVDGSVQKSISLTKQ